MKLIEAYRYANVLHYWMENISNRLASSVCRDISTMKDTLFYTVTKTEKRDPRDLEYNKETKNITVSEEDPEFKAIPLIELLEFLITEYHDVNEAIWKAKQQCSSIIDVEQNTNRYRQEAINVLMKISVLRNEKRVETPTGSYDNEHAEAGQSSYRFTSITEAVTNFDKKAVLAIQRRLQKAASDTSMEIDTAKYTLDVDFTPHFNPNDHLSQVYEQFVHIN